jgi:hypothetical protein
MNARAHALRDALERCKVRREISAKNFERFCSDANLDDPVQQRMHRKLLARLEARGV